MLTATDARGVVTSYAYNGFGDMTGLTSPDRGTWIFTFDAQGRHATTTDPRGVVVSTSFDALSRPIVRTFSAANVASDASGFEPGNVVQTFVYDVCPNGRSRLCQITDASGTTAYTYNPWGEVVGKAWTGKAGGPANGITLSSGYGYETATGRLASITFPSGKTQVLTYGNDGQPLSLAYAGQGVVANVAWTATGQVAGWHWPQATGWSGIHSSVSFTYDLDGRPTQIADLDQRTLAWDVGDRLVGVNDPADASRSQLYGYDSLDRLTSADIGAWNGPVAFTYDAGGNRTSVSDSQGDGSWQYAYGLTSNRLVSQSSIVGGNTTASFASAYDAMGNLVSDGIGLQLSYDATGRLARGAKGPQEMTARYNAMGQRMVKASGSQTRVYAVDEMGRPLGVYVLDANASNGFRVEEEYIHLDGWRTVAVVRPNPTSGMTNPQIFPILSDHLGTPRKVLDGATGQTRWAWDAKQPFGHEMPLENPTPGLPVFTFDLRFPGQRFDEETGLFHNGFRDYHPGLGRYVQSDPLGLEAGWNTYTYVKGNPNSLIDPEGLLQRDSTGRIIFHPQGLPISIAHASGKYETRAQPGYVYTDNGKPVIVFKNVPGGSAWSENMNFNCHGYSLGDSSFWINNPEVQQILDGDGYKDMGKKVLPMSGDIIVYRNNNNQIVHSAILHPNGFTTHKPGASLPHIVAGTIENTWPSSNYSIYRKSK